MFSSSFRPPPLDLALTSDEIHVWCAPLDLSVSRFEMLSQTLSLDERMRAGRFHFEKDRKHFIIGRGILRIILSYYLGVEPSRLQFCYGKRGKPALADTFGNGILHFNLSHSEGLALYAFSRDYQVGADIEYIRPIPEVDHIVERFFSAIENNVFRALPESKKKEAFFNCWTRKEAFIKAIGDGLFWPVDTFDVSLAPGEPPKLLRIEGDSKEASRWSIHALTPAPNYVGACAVRTGGTQLRVRHGWITCYD